MPETEILSRGMQMARGGSKGKGNPAWGIAAAILVAIGLFLVVQGFVIQLQLQGGWDSTSMAWIIGYYFVGAIFIGAAKMLKWKMWGGK